MQLIVHLDAQGLKSVAVESAPGERQQAHSLFEVLRPHLEKLGLAAQEAAGREMGSVEDEERETTSEHA